MANLNTKKHDADVIVIGCGAGGGVVAKELGEAGFSVIVLEAGKRYNPATDYPTDKQDFEIHAPRAFDPDDDRRDLVTSGSHGFYCNRVKGVGGATLHYVAISPRFHESDFRVRTEDGVADDWPINYTDLEPYYELVENELGVSGPTGLNANPFEAPRTNRFPTPPHDLNLAGRILKRGADKLGLHLVREPLAIPTLDWNNRPACINAGTCALGCQIAAKSSIDVTYVPKAEATGRVSIRPQSMAREITVASDGRAEGVIFFDAQGQEQQLRARAIVVAGSALETPRLLLMSKSSKFPHGLANSSGCVGKYFMEHLTVFAYGVFEERLDPWRGVPSAGMLQDYYATKKSNSYVRGWTILGETGQLWPFATARRVGGWGKVHKERMKKMFAHMVALATVGEQLPDARNQITLDPVVTDIYGLPVPHIVNEPRDNDSAMLKAISPAMADLLKASGATEVWDEKHRPGRSSHYLGTCRMGLNPETSVVNEWGRAHDVPNLFIGDGSVFVTGAAVNPALTISALATRAAEGIINAFENNEL